MEVAHRRANLQEQRFGFSQLFLVLRIGRVAQVVQGSRDHFGRRVEEAYAAALELGSVLRLEQHVPGIDGIDAQRGLDLLRVVADADGAPHVREGMLVVFVAGIANGLEQRRVEVFPVRQLGLVQLLVNPGLDLLGQEIVGWHDDVVTGLARQQLGLKGLVAVEHVVDHLDTGLVFEFFNGVWCDVIGPVVDVQYFICCLSCPGHHTHQGEGEKGLASFFKT